MKRLRATKKKFVATLIFSLISTIGLIIHGVFFDLDFQQIERLTIGGFIFTFVLVFGALLILEEIFELEDKVEFQNLERRISKLEKRRHAKS